ncbi:MAG: phytanoyl-CoA dioxygenase family protein, partial [Chitinophagaceae bacterium]|nr:phytanoyl-CoA dioxygenase family protein [Chitinophagaceae bacterium]
FNLKNYLDHVIGVTVNENAQTEKVLLLSDKETSPYILTKPLHQSQQVIETSASGVLFSLDVQLNFELEREILGFGDHIKVIAPERLKKRIKDTLESAFDRYQYEFDSNGLHSNIRKLIYKGYSIFHHVFTKKEVNRMRHMLYSYFKATQQSEDSYAVRNLLEELPGLKSLVMNSNLSSILKAADPNLFLTKAIYFNKTQESNWYVTWHQDIVINVKKRVETPGFTGWTQKSGVHGVVPPDDYLKSAVTVRIHLDDTDETNGALKVIPGSQNHRLTDDQINLLTQNSVPYISEVNACGIQILKPLLLHASSKATSDKPRRVIHLEFNSKELPKGLEWAERWEMSET